MSEAAHGVFKAAKNQACLGYRVSSVFAVRKVLSGVDGTAAHDGPSIACDAEELIRTKDVQVRAVFAASSAVFLGHFALGTLKRPDDIVQVLRLFALLPGRKAGFVSTCFIRNDIKWSIHPSLTKTRLQHHRKKEKTNREKRDAK